MPLDLLEPGALKGARRVLRGPRPSNGPGLPDRDVRMVKLQQKISGSWRTLAGARAYCTIGSYLSTTRKHDVDFLDGLRRMLEGHVWLPGET